MEKLKKFDLQNAEILDKKGMKEVTGGNSTMYCNADVDCPAGLSCVNGMCGEGNVDWGSCAWCALVAIGAIFTGGACGVLDVIFCAKCGYSIQC